MGTIKDQKYKIIKNFFDNNEIKVLQKYCTIRHRNNFDQFDYWQNDNQDTKFYADPLMESFLLTKFDLMEKETNLKLHPTYAFWRMYTKFADLKKHTDRPACEVSVTAMIGSDGTKWPIFMNGTPLELEVGDAAIYLGCEVPHWREEFEGDWHAQVFMHYVDANGPNKEWNRDKRTLWGTRIR
tara:strand:- start:440 stop:988 length:549 start_codon:yes stop_codon:yes gene_type:complete